MESAKDKFRTVLRNHVGADGKTDMEWRDELLRAVPSMFHPEMGEDEWEQAYKIAMIYPFKSRAV